MLKNLSTTLLLIILSTSARAGIPFGELDIVEVCLLEECELVTKEYKEEIKQAVVAGVIEGTVNFFTGKEAPRIEADRPVKLIITDIGASLMQNDLITGETEFLGSEEKYFEGAGLFTVSYFRRWNGNGWTYYSENQNISGPPSH